MRQNKYTKGFTLIELLTVIAIIGVLAALLFPAIKAALTKAETSKAQAAITGLSTAFRAYYTEYGKWPLSDSTVNKTYFTDQYIVGLLKGSNVMGAVSTVNPSASYQGNPRGIIFLDFKQADMDGSGNFVDPWKTLYRFRFDVTYINQVMDPFTGGGTVNPLSTGFIVWSDGPDMQEDPSCGDPPGPYVTSGCLNKDNVKSW